MTLKPTDMLEIQSAIDQYERKFPRRPAPSAEVALAWRLGKRVLAKREKQSTSEAVQHEGSRLADSREKLRLQWHTWQAPKDDDDEPPREPVLLPLVKGVLLLGWWSAVAVAVASVFFFGAIVGGLK